MSELAQRIKAENEITGVLRDKGVGLIGAGPKFTARCPFHEDRNPSLSVNAEKQVWLCHAGCGGGDVIDLLARFEGTDARGYLSMTAKRDGDSKTQPAGLLATAKAKPETGEIEKVYSYRDLSGGELYQVVRYRPKGFRQRHCNQRGDWVWSMDGVTRVLYQLPEVQKAREVWVVEGEKDADSLIACGFTATCNVGGAGKWLDAYTESLADKDVVICGDNDKPGEDHVVKVMGSLAGKVRSLRRVRLPSDFKDVTDFILSIGDNTKAATQLVDLRDRSQLLVRGLDLPLKSIAEMEVSYAEFVAKSNQSPIDLSRWLPSFRKACRKLVPGDLVTILAGTGVGKTAILQNICGSLPDIPTVFFQMELSEEAMYERMVAHRAQWSSLSLESRYGEGERLGEETLSEMFQNLLVCTRSGLCIGKVSEYVEKAELKMGQKPRLVLLDYIQLISGRGESRYERFSQIAEDARQMANRLGVTVIMTSQIRRKTSEPAEVAIGDAKESGSIENSSSLLLGAWKTEGPKGSTQFFIKVLKNSRGPVGLTIETELGDGLQITERVGPDDDWQ